MGKCFYCKKETIQYFIAEWIYDDWIWCCAKCHHEKNLNVNLFVCTKNTLQEKMKKNFIKKEGKNMTKQQEKDILLKRLDELKTELKEKQEEQELVVPSRNQVNKKLQKKEIDWNKNTLLEFPLYTIQIETEKAIKVSNCKGYSIWFNKQHCYKAKKYEFKPSFYVKVYHEIYYTINDIINDNEQEVSGEKLIKMMG